MTSRGHTHFHLATLTAASLALILGSIPDTSWARPGGGGGRGAPSSIHRPGGGGAGGGARPAPRPGGGGGGGGVSRPAGGNTVNRGGNTINRGGTAINSGNRNVNINNNVNVDVDHDWDHDGWDYHPVAAGVAFGTAAAVTAAVIGSVVYSVPPSCQTVVYANVSYSQCGTVWYEPRYAGSSVSYVVVNAPY